MIAPSDADFGDTLQIVLRYSGQSSVKRGKVQSEKTLGGGEGEACVKQSGLLVTTQRSALGPRS